MRSIEPIGQALPSALSFDLNPASKDVTPLSDEQLVTFIVVAVDAQMVHRAR